MDTVLKIVVMGRACRNTANIKNRQPIAKLLAKADKEVSEELDGFYLDIIKDELNVKAVELTDDVREFTSYNFKPQLKTVGPKYGKLLGKIKESLQGLDGNASMDELNEKGALVFDYDGEKAELTKDDLLIEMIQKEGYVTEGDNKVTVVIDTKLTPELIEEGFVREIISKIQTMRKEAGFEVMDRITVYESGNDKIRQILTDHGDSIKRDVLAESIVTDGLEGYQKEWSINEEKVTLGVKKL